MLGVLEVVEYSLKERFKIKYLHQVSYLRLQDVIGVCLSYCCLSGTICKRSRINEEKFSNGIDANRLFLLIDLRSLRR